MANEWKSMGLLAVVLGAVLAGGAMAYFDGKLKEVPGVDSMTRDADGAMIVRSGGAEVRIRDRSVILIDRQKDEATTLLFENAQAAEAGGAVAAKFGVTPLQGSALKGIDFSLAELTGEQREAIKKAYVAYAALKKAVDAQTTPATRAVKIPAAPRPGELEEAERKLYQAVAATEEGKAEKAWEKVARVKRVLTAEQFEKMSAKTPAGK